MVLLIEVKLESDKGSAGDPDLDQLARYARLAQRFADEGTKSAVAYLTVGDPMPDIEESIAQLKGSHAAARIFGLQWAMFMTRRSSRTKRPLLMKLNVNSWLM